MSWLSRPTSRATVLHQDIELLSFVGQHIASALSRARAIAETKRLLAETNQRAAELAIINSVQSGLAGRLDSQQMYDLVGDKIQEIFDAQVVDIGLIDRAEHDGVHLHDRAWREVAQTKRCR